MDCETSTKPDVDLLEGMLIDETTKPTSVPLLLLENITNCFSDDRKIGSGGFAVVYKGIVGNAMIAVKKLTKYDLPEKKFLREVECLIKAKHKNIVRFLGYCYETKGEIVDFKGKTVISDIRNWLLCFEYVPNGSLDNYITDASRGLEWRKRYEIIKGICEGLLHLHDKRILHLDLKPGNILLDEHMVPKIADFGLSVCLREDQNWASTSNLCGTLGYLPPEFFAGQQGFASDIYSLGVIIVEIVTGQKWYPEYENVVENWMNRLEGSDQMATQLDQVKVCTNIGIECMDIDPKKRPDARHIIDRLDKTTSTIETIISSSLLDRHVSFPKDQYCQEKNSKLSSKDLEMDTKESAEMEELAEYGWTHGIYHCQQGQEETPVDQWSLWGARDMKQNVSPEGAIISGSISGVPCKLKNRSISNKKLQREILRYGGSSLSNNGSSLRNLAATMFISKGFLKQFLKDEKFIGKGVFGEVYKGLAGDEPVVVMKRISDAVLDINQFVREFSIQSCVRHKNIVKMIGVCLDADVPMLVYEFLSNGSLHEILHRSNLHLNLGLRLSIAAGSAAGLAYIHSNHVKSLHGNLKPTNIFLDHKLVAKISEFGILRMFGVDTRMIGSDITYMDPVYLQTGVLTKKSDVYSFGVVILELLTRKKATHDDNNGLVRELLENHKMGRKSTELFDQEIAARGDLEFVDKLAEIAMECLSQDMDLRPTMEDVAKRFSILSRSYVLALIQKAS
uniref:Uncharacterized protein n=3 Tax=Avena sativa TaxID=4498 RepID=A0ACD5TBA8_AVESA